MIKCLHFNQPEAEHFEHCLKWRKYYELGMLIERVVNKKYAGKRVRTQNQTTRA